MKLGIYCRQSRDKYDSVSIPDQKERGIAKATELKIEYKIYVDEGKSAAYETLDNRKGMQDLLADVASGEITIVWALDEARISRNENTKLLFKMTLKDKNVILYTDKEGKIDFNDLNDEFFSGMRTLIAQQMIRTTSKNVKNALLYNAKAGKVMGGLLKPFGYKKATDGSKLLIIDEDEAVIIKHIFALCIQGYGTLTIAKILNEEGIPTKGSKYLKNGLKVKDKYTEVVKIVPPNKILWAGNTILSILKNPIYKGERKHMGITVKSPVIIDSVTWEKAQGEILKHKHRGGRTTHKYLLNDLCYCGRCGSGFRGRTRISKRDHYYYCASKRNNKVCGIRSINITYFEDIIWHIVSNSTTIVRLALNEVNKLKSPAHIEELKAQKKKLENKIKNEETAKSRTHELYKAGVIELEEAKNDMALNNDNIKSLNESLSQIIKLIDSRENTIEIIDDVKEFQKQLKLFKGVTDYELKHQIIRMFIEKITIDFDDKTQQFCIQLVVKLSGDRRGNSTWYLDKENENNLYDSSFNRNDTVFKPRTLVKALPPSSTGNSHLLYGEAT